MRNAELIQRSCHDYANEEESEGLDTTHGSCAPRSVFGAFSVSCPFMSIVSVSIQDVPDDLQHSSNIAVFRGKFPAGCNSTR